MWKLIKRLLLVGLLGWGVYVVYDQYRAGHFTRPDMPEGAFSISYANGLRAIIVDRPDEKATRRYFGFPVDVPFYLKETWSFCSAPREEEKVQVATFMKERNWPGERFEVVCRIEIDKEVVVRGVITSVPKT
ncbi:hypothetical protein [Agrobacterium tumefaciens]|uniref:hypothetical protein n=1 Tax=Agrobacterium tumefaciens TaxID=358 RepID=UPI0015743E51|nr:hypothetical protein [Agrobacterium tumefaciens]